MWRLALVMLLPLSLFSQQLVYEFQIDTAQYEGVAIQCNAIQAPNIIYNSTYGMAYTINAWAKALKKKRSNQYDIFTLQGKSSSVTIPASIVPQGTILNSLIFSQTIIDNDSGWEYIAGFYDTVNEGHFPFKVVDDNGTVLLADEGYASYAYDGQNTYVTSGMLYPDKIWKFRSNVSTMAPLAKSAAAGPAPIMALMPSGGFRVSLQPASGGTSVQIFDMLGRQVFGKIIQDIKTPTSFMIPAGNVPSSPFIAKVNNSNGSFFKENIPVR
jgi:hypothetical protein